MQGLLLSLLFGLLIGLALGLTGGGGSIFAVPLLVYALAVPAHEAVGVSLAAVGATAAVGFVQRWRRREVEVSTGLLFAVTGMLGAPLGTWLNSLLPSAWLLVLFAVLMLAVAGRMWFKARAAVADSVAATCAPAGSPGPMCRRDSQGTLQLTSQCAVLLALLGLATGVLSGLFGVGGGFVIVPVLVLFSGMGMHRAIATSLMVITLISLSGVTAYVMADRAIDFRLTGLFALGGVLGMYLGTMAARRISGAALQKGFSAAIVAVALFTIMKSFL